MLKVFLKKKRNKKTTPSSSFRTLGILMIQKHKTRVFGTHRVFHPCQDRDVAAGPLAITTIVLSPPPPAQPPRCPGAALPRLPWGSKGQAGDTMGRWCHGHGGTGSSWARQEPLCLPGIWRSQGDPAQPRCWQRRHPCPQCGAWCPTCPSSLCHPLGLTRARLASSGAGGFGLVTGVPKKPSPPQRH